MSDVVIEDPILQVAGLHKTYGEVAAVTDVSFAVRRGGSIGIVGESGSGKTTVAKMITGQERPTSGTIMACGRDRSTPAKAGAERRRRGREVQIVFQDPYSSLDRRQPVDGAIDEVVRLHRPDWTREQRAARVAELVDMVGLDARQATALPRALSGGQRQRVAIARALGAEPDILILDESVAALDVSIQAQVLNLFMDLREQLGITYVLISHDLAVIRQLTETVVVMHRGIIVERGRTQDVLDDPQHPYSQRLRASVPTADWDLAAVRSALSAAG